MPADESTQPARRERPLFGYVIVLSGTVVWALTGIVIKILLTTYALEKMTIAFWRVFVVTAFLFFALLLINPRHFRIARRDLGFFLLYGLIGVALHQFVWISSVQLNGAAVATVMIYTAPVIVSLFAWRFLNEPADRGRFIALALALAGCALVARAYDPQQIRLNFWGLLAGVGSAFTFATYSLLGQSLARRYSPWTALFYAFFFGTIFLLPVGLFAQEFLPVRIGWSGGATLVFLGIVPTLCGFGAYTIGLSHLPASTTSILAAFEPVTTAIIAYFAFKEVLSPPQLIGGILILIGVILLRPKGAPVSRLSTALPELKEEA